MGQTPGHMGEAVTSRSVSPIKEHLASKLTASGKKSQTPTSSSREEGKARPFALVDGKVPESPLPETNSV